MYLCPLEYSHYRMESVRVLLVSLFQNPHLTTARVRMKGWNWIQMEYDSNGRRVGVRAVIHLPIFVALWDLHTLWDVDGGGTYTT